MAVPASGAEPSRQWSRCVRPAAYLALLAFPLSLFAQYAGALFSKLVAHVAGLAAGGGLLGHDPVTGPRQAARRRGRRSRGVQHRHHLIHQTGAQVKRLQHHRIQVNRVGNRLGPRSNGCNTITYRSTESGTDWDPGQTAAIPSHTGQRSREQTGTQVKRLQHHHIQVNRVGNRLGPRSNGCNTITYRSTESGTDSWDTGQTAATPSHTGQRSREQTGTQVKRLQHHHIQVNGVGNRLGPRSNGCNTITYGSTESGTDWDPGQTAATPSHTGQQSREQTGAQVKRLQHHHIQVNGVGNRLMGHRSNGCNTITNRLTLNRLRGLITPPRFFRNNS